MKHYVFTILAIITLSSAIIAEEPLMRSGFYDSYNFSPQVLRSIWIDLDKSPVMDGGLYTRYLGLSNLVSYKRLSEWAKMSIFIKGPHTRDHINISSKTDFGYYNKNFVIWMRNNLIPAADDISFKLSTQHLYNTHLKVVARNYYIEYKKMKAQPDLVANSKNVYLASMAAGVDYHPQLDNYDVTIISEDPPVTVINKTPSGERIAPRKQHKYLSSSPVVIDSFRFWLRRSLDGTDTEFILGLEKLLRTYDREFLERTKVTAAK